MSTSEMPSGVSIEDVYVIEATYTPDAGELRVPVRGAHLGRLQELIAAGTVIEAGAFKDLSGSLLVVRAESEEAALALARDDVYVRAGVWDEITARPFGRVAT